MGGVPVRRQQVDHGQDARAGGHARDAAQDAESAGHDAEEAAAPLEAEAEHEAKALAEDAEHDSAAIVADVHERPQAAPVPAPLPASAYPNASSTLADGNAVQQLIALLQPLVLLMQAGRLSVLTNDANAPEMANI